MIDYILSPEAMVLTSGSSKGTQAKYYDNGYWYKENRNGYEGLAEELATKLLKCSNLNNFAEYERCLVNGKNGCRSKNFLKENEHLLSFERLHMMNTGMHFVDAIRTYNTPEERIKYTIEFMKECTGFDVSSYLGNILMFDAVILNQDRHFNNLCIIMNQKTGEVSECPIFDNGDSLLSNFGKFPPMEDLQENLNHCVSLPFSANAFLQANILSSTLKFDYNAIKKMLEEEKECRAIEVLRHQIQQYRSIIPEKEETELEKFIRNTDTMTYSNRKDDSSFSFER